MSQAIVFERVRFAYPRGRDVLVDLDLAVAAGETLALVGRSGAGKSTLLHLVNRLDEPSAGRVLVEARDTRDWDPIALRRRVGFVLQHVGLFPHLTVARNIGLLPSLDGWTPARVDARVGELLHLVGLSDDYAHRWPDELSGGQQQRVGVARALVLDPPIILMDEPFGALDPLTRLALHREFRRIQATLRKTVIIVTHDMREAFALATQVGVIDEGRLVALGSRTELRASPHPFVRELLATLDADVADATGEPDIDARSSATPAAHMPPVLDRAAADDLAAAHASSEEARSEEARPEEVRSEDTPSASPPSNIAPAQDARTENALSADARPENAMPEDARSEHARSAHASSESALSNVSPAARDASAEDVPSEDPASENAGAENAAARDTLAASAPATHAPAAHGAPKPASSEQPPARDAASADASDGSARRMAQPEISEARPPSTGGGDGVH